MIARTTIMIKILLIIISIMIKVIKQQQIKDKMEKLELHKIEYKTSKITNM